MEAGAQHSNRDPDDTIAMANKSARIIWAIMVRGEPIALATGQRSRINNDTRFS
jgi:hypothetical protein